MIKTNHMRSILNKPNHISGSVSAMLTSLLFAVAVILAPFAYDAGASVFLLLSIRFIICFFCSALFVPNFYKVDSKINKKEWLLICIVGGSFVVQAYGYMKSVQLLPVSIAVTIFYTFPIITFVLEKIVIQRTLKITPILSLVCTLFGIWLLFQGEGEWNVHGAVWALIAAFMQSCVNITSQRFSSVSGWRLVNYTSLIPAILFLLMYHFLDNTEIVPKAMLWSTMAAISFCIGLWLFYKSIDKIGSVRTASILYLEPVFTFLLAMLFFGDSLSAHQWAGVFLVTLAISATELLEREKIKI